ncbi:MULTISPECIES: ECF transporter S component [Brevibacillus]|jgi:energy-coupling factor transport system substrate-specific component|uniref:ABC transporter permease n=1 Tax=Brevibacillus parabrevis TaxID=54914 RepID=A0A4Y3PNX2_BREPA|nr:MULTISPECIES: ECF transporter S component [Brevibacillus]MBU8714585.1 ECF transporter S component [Brevibacillus parabrevis]MDH6351189.1 energy-coupling factor transport system substrate-specific component [Brevibacillus sp. 1238]MDR4998571.1 ECF transporter S component [Brevibacillus parabrevis]MED2254704.1 ECF transporter S component [Brevibacillus parabrevis]NRQ54264.1 ECF transporter S component [Brevibacillus sp. HD1.4A]
MKTGIKNDFTLMAILLIPVCVAINMVGFQIAQLLRLPIFLDSIGTLVIAMVAGPWVALVAGLITNLINSIFNPVYLPFSLVSMAVGLAAGFLSMKGMFKKVWKVIIAGIILAFVSTIIAAPITVILFGGVTGSTGGAITAVLLASGQQIWTAVFSTQFIQEIGDKLLSAFICFLIVRNMSDRYLSKLNYGQIYMKD